MTHSSSRKAYDASVAHDSASSRRTEYASRLVHPLISRPTMNESRRAEYASRLFGTWAGHVADVSRTCPPHNVRLAPARRRRPRRPLRLLVVERLARMHEGRIKAALHD